MALSSNDKIANRMVRHSVYLERFKNFEADKIAALLNDEVLPDVLASIFKINRIGLNPRKRREAERIMRQILNEGMDKIKPEFMASMKEFSLAEGVFSQQAMEKVIPYGVTFKTPGARLLNTIVTAKPFEGEILTDWFSDLGKVMQKNLNRQIRVGMTLGEDVGTLTQRIRGTAAAKFGDGVWQTQLRKAEAVTRTAISHVSNQARSATFKANEDILKGERFLNTLDDKTTLICIRAGEVDEYGLGEGVYPVGAAPVPPLHFNCRSTITPVTKSFKELGIPLKEMPPGFRRAMDGKVPENTTYGQWLKTQDARTQRNALGRTRAELFNRGMVKIENFQNDRGVTYKLNDLLKREGISREDVYSLAG